MSLILRYMLLDDIHQVVAIDREAFDTPWSARSYAYEIGESSYSYMMVLEHNHERPVQGWRRLVRSFNGSTATTEVRRRVIGYGGLWRIMDEAHISTIATHQDWRGKGFGELLLVAMIRRSVTLGAAYIVLEVRVSNEAAQNLYRKFNFKTVGVKNNYYRDNDEDAYDMRLDLKDPATLGELEARYQAMQSRFGFDDRYTETARPRL